MKTLELDTANSVHGVVRLADIPGCECAKRALEVALAGGHPIILIYRTGAPAEQILQSAHALAVAAGIEFRGMVVPSCPCGNYGAIAAPCKCSVRRITQHWKGISRRILLYEMAVEVVPPVAGKAGRRGEADEQIMARVRNARCRSAPDATISTECESYVRLYEREVDGSRTAVILKVAATIARLDSSAKIQPQHLAEAMQYQFYWRSMRAFLPKVGADDSQEHRVCKP